MRIDAIELTWFRGAADTVTLEPKGRSIVVYGENASGKSCFVDAVEHVLNEGRIEHLAHEYSGRRQEKGIVNSHTPEGRQTLFKIKFKGGSELTTEIKPNGAFTRGGDEAATMTSWDYRRTVLRQNEVSDFIRDTKGDKYSALLPLLGLSEMERAAENIRQLVKAVNKQSRLDQLKRDMEGVSNKRKETFGEADDDQIVNVIECLRTKYCTGDTTPVNAMTSCRELETSLKSRFNRFNADQQTFFTLQTIANLSLKGNIASVRMANDELAGTVEPLIAEKLEVLQSTSTFVDKLEDQKEVKCPACGRSIPVKDFQAHVTTEKERLKDIIATFNSRKIAISSLCDTIKSLKSNLDKTEVKTWRGELAEKNLADEFVYLSGLSPEALRTSISENDLKSIDKNLPPLIDTAASASKDSPPDVQQLAADQRTVETGKEVIESWTLAAEVENTEALISYLSSLERSIRDEIRFQSKKVIDEISSDIQGMWSILHPREPIEDVRLYVPEDTDKAIDIGLKFHGMEQNSPRLTLSEGHRNSLGLCIFLAMAKRDANTDRPLFLDDVVVSLDRNHRGMIAELLEKEFENRQVILLTHDRDWYMELRHQLQEARWDFKPLMPYDAPEIGIRWSDRTWTFDDARARLVGEPDIAGNIARKIMDIEFALLAERLKLRMPYLHREKNDHRVAHDFLLNITTVGEKCFQKRDDKVYEPHSNAIEALRVADKLLISWGNRTSHTFDLVKNEAEKLIKACELALEFFVCESCEKRVYKCNNASGKLVQCECGHLRWRYGKD